MASGVSVVIPHLNAGTMLAEAVASVLAQSAADCVGEILVVDDGSTDPASIETLERVAALPKVKVMANAGARGSAGGRNTGIRAARHPWIALLDADDVWLPDAVLARLRGLDRHPDVSWIGGDFRRWFPDRVDAPLDPPAFASQRDVYSVLFAEDGPCRVREPYVAFLRQALTMPSATMLHARVFDEVGGFDERYRRYQDYQFWIRAARRFDFLFVPEIIHHYRLHGRNITYMGAPREWTARMFVEVLAEEPDPALRALIRQRISECHLKDAYYWRANGDFSAAAASSLRALRATPRGRRGLRALRALAGAAFRRR